VRFDVEHVDHNGIVPFDANGNVTFRDENANRLLFGDIQKGNFSM